MKPMSFSNVPGDAIRDASHRAGELSAAGTAIERLLTFAIVVATAASMAAILLP